MSTWKLIPVQVGPHILTRVFAGTAPEHLVLVGELTLRREDHDDLTARLSVVPTEPDLHTDLHPQPGQAPAAPLPVGVTGWVPGEAENNRTGETWPDPSYREPDGEGLS